MAAMTMMMRIAPPDPSRRAGLRGRHGVPAQVPARRRRALAATITTCILMLVLLGSLDGCGALGATPAVATGAGPTPAPTLVPVLLPHRPPTTVVACGDTKRSYPRSLYREGNALLAGMLDAAVEPNAAALTAYVTLLDSRPYDPASTPLVIRIPAVPAQPAPPTLVPPPAPSGNPYADAQARHSVQRRNAATLQRYQQQLARQDAALARTQAAVRQQTNALRQLDPPPTSTPSSVFGCLALAADRLHTSPAVAGEKWLLIWSDLRDTSWRDYLPPSQLSLHGVHIRVLYLPCLSAGQCRCVKAFWRRVFEQAGAADIAFYDPAESTTLSAAPFFRLPASHQAG